MIVPPERLNSGYRQDWQRKALENIYILDAHGGSTFITLDNMGWIEQNPQTQDYSRVMPITELAPDKEPQAIALIKQLVPRAARWDDDRIRTTFLDSYRAHLIKHRGVDHAFAPTAEEQKRIYQIFNEMNKIPELTSQLAEDGYRVFVGNGITTARIFDNTIIDKALGAFDSKKPKTIFISGLVTYDDNERPQTIFEECGHAFHHLALHDDPILRERSRNFTYYFFDEQVGKLEKAKDTLETMAIKINLNQLVESGEVQARWSPEEEAIIGELNSLAQKNGTTPHTLIRAALESINNILQATDEIYMEHGDAEKMDELTTKSLMEVMAHKKQFGNDLSFLIDINGKVETYDAAVHNAAMAKTRYEEMYDKPSRDNALRFAEQIKCMLENDNRRARS